MKLDDIITLAKAGYTPKQVKELLEYVESSPQVKETDIKEVTQSDEQQQTQQTQQIEDIFEELIK